MNNSLFSNQLFLAIKTCIAVLMVCCSSNCIAQGINWFPDTSSAAKAAAAQDKIILLHFGAQWCRPCDQLETFVFTDPMVQRAFADKLIAVKVDADKRVDLVEEFGVQTLPCDVAVSPDGKILSKRKSPDVAKSYLKMISDFEATRTKMDDPNSQVENAAYQIQQANQQNSTVAQTAAFTPNFPYQPPVTPAASSKDLERQGQVVKNPFVQQSGSQFPNKLSQAPSLVPMVPGKIIQQNAPAAAMEMPKPVQMPGQLSLPHQMQLVDEQLPPAPEQNNFQSAPAQAEVELNQFAPSAPEATGDFNPNQFGQAKPVEPRNTALKRLEQSDVAARLVREQAQQKLANFSADPKVVMDDRFFGSHRANQVVGAANGNYQAKINLPQDGNSAVGFVPPQPPNFGAESAGSVMDRGVDPPGTPAKFASAGNSVLNGGPGSVVERGLNQASETPAKPNYALHGKCPVSLLTKSKWIDGEESIGCVHRNRIYIFSSQENLQLFQSDPDAYSPILAGYDPVIFEETGRLVDGLEDYGVFMGKVPRQRIVLFASPETRARFQLEPRKYLQSVRQAMEKSGGSTTMR